MDMERLHRVMARVRGEVPPELPRREGDELAGMLREIQEQLAAYQRLRMQSSGRGRVMLTRLWETKQRQYRALQTAYFSAAGDSMARNEVPMEREKIGFLTALRKLRQREEHTAAVFRRMNRSPDNTPLTRLYGEMAAECEHNVLALDRLLSMAVGK